MERKREKAFKNCQKEDKREKHSNSKSPDIYAKKQEIANQWAQKSTNRARNVV